MSEQENTYLFVYGTLRKGVGHSMYTFLDSYAEFICFSKFQGKLYDFIYYPGAVESNNLNDWVYGELYRLNNPDYLLTMLDKYEGCSSDDPEPSEFVRKKRTVQCTDGQRMSAWIYLYNLSTQSFSPIVSGDFLNP